MNRKNLKKYIPKIFIYLINRLQKEKERLRLYFLKRKVINAIMIFKNDKEVEKIINYLKKYPIYPIPYEFIVKYSWKNVKVNIDSDGDKYVIYEGKKLFFLKKWSIEQCQKCYYYLQLEQDKESPHRYLFKNRNPEMEDVVADVGAAEGIFSLSIIDNVKHVYLFEGNSEWNEPLNKTFSPYKDKVTIVNKFVGEQDSSEYITLDSYFKDKNITYLKADVEGMERLLLAGAVGVLEQKIVRCLLCAYHRPDDEAIIQKYCEKFGFDIEKNQGYMLFFYNENEFKAPFLRKGVIYCEKLK